MSNHLSVEGWDDANRRVVGSLSDKRRLSRTRASSRLRGVTLPIRGDGVGGCSDRGSWAAFRFAVLAGMAGMAG